MMGRSELCAWLRANSSGIYRPAAEAADEIEHLAAAKDQHFAQAMANGAKANELRDALTALLERYTDPVNCGDCGNWNPEQETQVIAARAALTAVSAA